MAEVRGSIHRQTNFLLERSFISRCSSRHQSVAFHLASVLYMPESFSYLSPTVHCCIFRLRLPGVTAVFQLSLSWILCTKVNSFDFSLQGQAMFVHFWRQKRHETLPAHLTTFFLVHNSLTGEPDANKSLQGRSNTRWKIQTKWPNGEKT